MFGVSGASWKRSAHRTLGQAAILLSVSRGAAYASPSQQRVGTRSEDPFAWHPVAERQRDNRLIDLADSASLCFLGKLPEARRLPLASAGPVTKPAAPNASEQRFTWRAPARGEYRLDFYPDGEPPARYRVWVKDAASGTELHRLDTFGVSLQLPCEAGRRLEIGVSRLDAAGPDTFELRIEGQERRGSAVGDV